MRRAAAAALAALGVGLLAACSSGASSTTTVPALTAVPTVTTLVAPSTEPAPTTTVVVTLPIPGVSTLPVTPPTPATTPPAVTTTAAGPSCDGGTLFAVLQATTELPAGTGAEAPLCAGAWATMIIGAPNRERALAVFTFEGAAVWRLANLGTDQACSGAAVPAALYAPLGCAQWETE